MATQNRSASRLRRQRGRPPLKKGEAKRSSFNTRLRDRVKERLEAEAANAGRSLSEEIEFRLERSFAEEDAKIAEFGDKMTYRLMKLLSLAKEWVEEDAGKKMSKDWETFFGVWQAWQRLLIQLGPKPPDGWVEGHTPPAPLGLLASERNEAAYKEALAKLKPVPQLGNVVADQLIAQFRSLLKAKPARTLKGKSR